MVDGTIRNSSTSKMEQDNVVEVMCRDGIPARVQRVKDESSDNPEAMITFGRRLHPELPAHDENGCRNEAGDIWYKDGYWREDGMAHPFDIVKVILNERQLASLPHHA